MRYLSQKIRHFFHVVSNVRPIVWISLYVALTPVFALIYWALPDGQFRIPDNAGTDFGSWLYYSIVTITTLGFGDYTPAHGWAQGVTAVEVICGLVILGFFLNAVGAMKSEIDVESEIEKQRLLHKATEKDKLIKCIPGLLRNLNVFINYCYSAESESQEKPDSSIIEGLLESASFTALSLDSLQNKVDLTLWPDLLEDCFSFVANFQMLSTSDVVGLGRKLKIKENNTESEDIKKKEIENYIKNNIKLAQNIEGVLTEIS